MFHLTRMYTIDTIAFLVARYFDQLDRYLENEDGSDKHHDLEPSYAKRMRDIAYQILDNDYSRISDQSSMIVCEYTRKDIDWLYQSLCERLNAQYVPPK